MIDMMTQTRAYAGPILYSDVSQRMRLAYALYSVELAHTRLKEPDLTAEQHNLRVRQLDVTLEEYWQIDNQIEAYLQRAREN